MLATLKNVEGIRLYSERQLSNILRVIEEYEAVYKAVNGRRCRVRWGNHGRLYIDKTPAPIFDSFSLSQMQEMAKRLHDRPEPGKRR